MPNADAGGRQGSERFGICMPTWARAGPRPRPAERSVAGSHRRPCSHFEVLPGQAHAIGTPLKRVVAFGLSLGAGLGEVPREGLPFGSAFQANMRHGSTLLAAVGAVRGYTARSGKKVRQQTDIGTDQHVVR